MDSPILNFVAQYISYIYGDLVLCKKGELWDVQTLTFSLEMSEMGYICITFLEYKTSVILFLTIFAE